MAFIDLGKLKFNWQGTWNSSTAYEVDDVVFHDNQTWVATADVAAEQSEPQANTSWSLMAGGLNYTGDYASGTTYYLHDMVTYGSSLYMLTGITETGSQTGIDPGSNPGSDNWEQLTPAPAANVMHTVGDMVFRNNANDNARLVIVEQVNKGLTVQEAPLETYSSRAFTYELNSTYGNVINTPGSIPAETYNITTKNQRANNYVIDGSDRDGDINWEYDGQIRVNIGDTIVFNNTVTYAAHPMAIRVASGGASVSTGTYSGEGTATVTWDTTGVTAGIYYYQCTNHTGMVGQIIVEDTTNRQGSAGSNGTMQVCRGKTYTITLDNVTSGLSYNLFNASAPQAGTTNAITADEGNSAPTGTSYSGSPVTFTFTPNETTPDIVYLSSASNTSDQVAITVNDLAYVPSWGTASPSTASGVDQREFKHWQDWYGGDTYDNYATPTWGQLLPQSSRDPGADVKVGGTELGSQPRRLYRGTGGTGNTVNWTVPDGVEKIRVTAIGGGGGGGCHTGSYYGGAGGGGGSFASGEYTVTEGEVITITVGHGGAGIYSGSRSPNGGTTSVISNGGTNINISAEGGEGGSYSTTMGSGGDSVVVGGNNLVAGSMIRSAGGPGGYGAWTAWASGPEGYASGGGGSAGSMFGRGGAGGSARSTTLGYEYSSCGGGGIGGTGGAGCGNYTSNETYPVSAGGGGGSAGNGGHGLQQGNSTGTESAPRPHGGFGGQGLADGVHIQGYIDHMPSVEGSGASGQQVNNRYVANAPTDHQTISQNNYSPKEGARYGDGEASHPANGWDPTIYNKGSDGLSYGGAFNRVQQAIYMGRPQALAVDLPPKAFNGILGRLWGGGGGGGGATSPNQYYSNRGGDGGSGAGGGGGQQYSTSHGIGGASQGMTEVNAEFSVWDVANMAWRVHDRFRKDDDEPGLIRPGTFPNINPQYSGSGGHGGALGGGGGGALYGLQGGNGGIGGGGGGAPSSYSPQYYGQGGHGGVGYVLIEWA